MTRVGYSVPIAILVVSIVVCTGSHGSTSIETTPGFRYAAQSFESEIEGAGASLRVAQTVTVNCIDGCLETISITIPYGEDELRIGNASPEDSGSIEVRTTTGASVARSIAQNQTSTEVVVRLPHPICDDQDIVLILRYTINDLPGDEGVSRQVMTLMDKIFGRDPSRFEVTYKPGVFDGRVDELVVRLLAPLDLLPIRWEPESNTFKLYDPGTGRVSINWQLREDIAGIPVFRILLGKGTRPYAGLILYICALFVPLILGLGYLWRDKLPLPRFRRSF